MRRLAPRDTGGVRLALLVLAVVVLLVVVVGWAARPVLPPGVGRWLNPVAYTDEISAAAQAQQLDVYLVLAVVKAESSFQKDAVSRVGAVGLMQLMPETAEWIAGRDDWKGPPQPDLRAVEDNLALGSYYLRFLRDMFDDDLVASLAAYNAGHGTVGRWLEDLRREGSGAGTLEPESIPYSDTRDFVRRVLEYRELYARIYPDL